MRIFQLNIKTLNQKSWYNVIIRNLSKEKENQMSQFFMKEEEF